MKYLIHLAMVFAAAYVVSSCVIAITHSALTAILAGIVTGFVFPAPKQ